MARYRRVEVKIWNDAKFAALSDRAKLLFVYLLTSPAQTSLGAMKASAPGLAAELGWDAEGFREPFRQLLSGGFVKHDAKACFLRLTNFLRYNPPENPNVVKSWSSLWDLLPECTLKAQLLQELRGYTERLPEGFRQAFREAFGAGMPNPEPEPEPDPDVLRPPLPPAPRDTDPKAANGTPKKKAKAAPKPPAGPVPDADLPHGPTFAVAWRDWEQQRRQKKKPLTELSVKYQLRALEGMPEARAVANIRLAIARNWEGFVPDHRDLDRLTAEAAGTGTGPTGSSVDAPDGKLPDYCHRLYGPDPKLLTGVSDEP